MVISIYLYIYLFIYLSTYIIYGVDTANDFECGSDEANGGLSSIYLLSFPLIYLFIYMVLILLSKWCSLFYSSIYLSIHTSIYVSIYPSIHLSTLIRVQTQPMILNMVLMGAQRMVLSALLKTHPRLSPFHHSGDNHLQHCTILHVFLDTPTFLCHNFRG